MKNEMMIPPEICQEADNLSKETGLSFRTLLEVLFRAYLASEIPVLCRVGNSEDKLG